mmetsp:Transcript_7392/g.22855  ORF Transcript_7392/g.22855 Transcript_7392/m.22855 type:complete len:116 (-) Transcript_7392:531-878(-)|eukprot:scaffold213921_cov26-Tisochrysis_lutea.AAC.2
MLWQTFPRLRAKAARERQTALTIKSHYAGIQAASPAPNGMSSVLPSAACPWPFPCHLPTTTPSLLHQTTMVHRTLQPQKHADQVALLRGAVSTRYSGASWRPAGTAAAGIGIGGG